MLRNIMGAASKSEIAAACVNARLEVNHHATLMEMKHVQLATPLEIDNATAHDVLTK